MKINTGQAKGRVLRSVPGETTRPVTDRVKQAVFNILGDDTRDSAWLDLFAGTGAIGIEALSRGARHATFVDIESAATRVIQDNLRATRLEAGARVLRQDAFQFLRGYPNQRYDFIYIAPPQFQGMWERALLAIDASPDWLAENGAVIVQINPREYLEAVLTSLEMVDQRRYGNTLVCFYERLSADGVDGDDGGDGVD